MNKIAMKHLYEEKYNSQKCLMKIIEYNNYKDIVVEFQDEYKTRVHTNYEHFLSGGVKNPYSPTSYNVGIIGNKYPVSINCKPTKEYTAWQGMLRRCFDKNVKNKYPTYKDVTCCEEWFLFENFYEWLHSQENFNKWYQGERWAVDKDILVKGNKIYSPETCCLVPINVNQLFKKRFGDAPICIDLQINISKIENKFQIKYQNPFTNKTEYFTSYNDIESALQTCKTNVVEHEFKEYKINKENNIKRIAQEEYDKCNITKQCYDAMMNYEVEITD